MEQPRFTELETQRLRLKKLETTDWETVSYLRSDATVNQFVKRKKAETKEKALAFIVRIRKGVDAQHIYHWKIVKKELDEMIGSICLWNFSEDRKTAEIGYDLSAAHQKQGIMDEALKSVIHFGSQKLQLHRIEAYTHTDNTSSRKLLERNGFTLVEGKKDADNLDNVIYELQLL